MTRLDPWPSDVLQMEREHPSNGTAIGGKSMQEITDAQGFEPACDLYSWHWAIIRGSGYDLESKEI